MDDPLLLIVILLLLLAGIVWVVHPMLTYVAGLAAVALLVYDAF